MTEHLIKDTLMEFIDYQVPKLKETVISRFGDMDPYCRLEMLVQDDGDICLSIVPGPNDESPHAADIEFCTIGIGGGQSPHTFKALCALFIAIQRDNKERPQSRKTQNDR